MCVCVGLCDTGKTSFAACIRVQNIYIYIYIYIYLVPWYIFAVGEVVAQSETGP